MGDFAMEHNNEYRKKLNTVHDLVDQDLDVRDTFIKIMIPFIKKN